MARLDLNKGYDSIRLENNFALLNEGYEGDVTRNTTGTAGTGVVAVEYGDGYNHVTKLTLSSVAFTIGDNASLADGALIYTIPAGVAYLEVGNFSVGLTLTSGTPTTDTPEVGLGTTIASGANATLGDVATTAEDIAGPFTCNDVAGTAELSSFTSSLFINTADAHTIHLNYADAWADVTDTAATASGTIYIKWTYLGP